MRAQSHAPAPTIETSIVDGVEYRVYRPLRPESCRQEIERYPARLTRYEHAPTLVESRKEHQEGDSLHGDLNERAGF